LPGCLADGKFFIVQARPIIRPQASRRQVGPVRHKPTGNKMLGGVRIAVFDCREDAGDFAHSGSDDGAD